MPKMLITARATHRAGLRCECCGHPDLRSASRRRANAKARDAERRMIKRRERREEVS